ncbi:MAG: CpXC domain-containing protein [Candidatus Promineifilaceae bacterium]
MYTQISCPNCGTNYTAEVHQVIDVGRNPELKAALLSGQLNVAVCPSCGTAGQLASAMLYHDPENELFMVYVPQELNLDQVEREKYIGQLTREVVDSTPPEQRRYYMFQPMTMLTMQSFLEKVLETEGITKEMIERQQKQAELLNTLITADKDVADYLLKERASEIDEVFFAMLRQYIEVASQTNDNKQLVPLINLQAKLMTETEVGRRLEKQQIALHALNRAAKAADGLTPAILLEHILKNQQDPEIVAALAQVGLPAMSYEFFTGLTNEIERQQLAGNEEAVERLSMMRTDLLKMQEDAQEQTRQVLGAAQETLEAILSAEDIKLALNANMESLDDAFMYVLAAEIARAQETNDAARLEKLNSLRDLLVEEAESQTPPEVRFLNKLVRAETAEEMEQVADDNLGLLSPDLVAVIDALQDQAQSTGQQELLDRLSAVKRLLLEKLEE